MEILFVSHKYPPATGGMEKQSYQLIHQMSVLTKVHAVVYNGMESRFSFFSQLSKRMGRLIQDNPGISIIHYNDGLLGAFGMLQLRHKNIKRTVTLHGLDVVFPSMIYQKLILPKFNSFDLIVCVSHATAVACQERAISSDKIVVINNGVDAAPKITAKRDDINKLLLKQYNISIEGKKVLVAIGRPVRRKGFSWFIENVMPLIHKDFVLLLIGPFQQQKSGFTFLIRFLPAFISRRIELFLGTPSDETNLRRLKHKPSISYNVIRLGKLPADDVSAILKISDAFIMPNIEVHGDMEGFGLVCLEACIQGARVFAAASGGIPDAVVHGRNGILLPPGHIASWVHALNTVADYPELQLEPQKIISFTVENYGWQKMAKEYLFHFHKL